MLRRACRIVPAFILPFALSACMGLSIYSPTRNKLDDQVGKNIKELLPKWPEPNGAEPFVDKVDDQTTSYTYVYGYTPDHYENRGYSVNGPGSVTYNTYSVFIPASTDCWVIFYTDKAGTILRYDMKTNGKISYNSCGRYISGYGF
ncbi:hypothetical protein [Bordetella genomosp. 13]|uniref:hypothetical protein n=1 Tax=Bordetella genomosp. 13 TaxID=463040 RepID=UPI0021B60A23|nr:hypothetical protein [Bordetella genomosp. 13]